jgi:hypothetical protein
VADVWPMRALTGETGNPDEGIVQIITPASDLSSVNDLECSGKTRRAIYRSDAARRRK